jgi:putative ABC transport system permease protein
VTLLDVKRKRDVRRQRGQFIAVAVTIGLGVMLFASTYDAYRNLESSYNFTYERLNFADITVVGADEGFVGEAAEIEGVETAESRTQADIPMRVDGDAFLGRVVGYPPDGQPQVNKIDISEGDYLDPDDESAVVIESHMAGAFEIEVGDTFEILVGGSWVEVDVVGIAVSAEYIWPARDSQDIFPLPGTFGVAFISDTLFESVPAQVARPDVQITYGDDVDIEETDKRVSDAAFAAGAGDVIPRADHPSHSTLLLDVNGFQSMSVMFPTLFMIAAGMAAFVLLTRIVYAQRSQIGTMRASGMGRRMVLRHYLSYGVRLGLIAGVVGLVIGMVSAYAITGLYTQALGIPDTVRAFHWITPIVGILFGLAAGAFGAWAPARTAFRMSPAEAMRGDVPMERGKSSLLERIVPPLRRLPVRWLMVLRGIGRNKRRSFSTILGVILGLTLIMVSWGMIDTIVLMLDQQFNEVALEDANVVLVESVTADAVADVGAVDGVDVVEVVPSLEATIELEGQSFSTALSGYQAETVVHGFPDGVPEKGLVAGSGLADEIGVSKGDVVRIELPTLELEFFTTFVGFVDEPIGIFLYMNVEELDEIVGTDLLILPGVSALKTVFDDDIDDREAVIDDIKDLDSVGIVVDARALYDLMQQFLGFFYIFVGMMLVFGGLMAFALMYNTISVNVAERSGEFATMRANGLSHRGIASLIATENVLLTLMGIIPGLIIGYAVGAFFMSQFSVDAFSLQFQMRPSSIVLSAVAMIVVALLSLIPAIRTVKRLDIGEVVRERAA